MLLVGYDLFFFKEHRAQSAHFVADTLLLSSREICRYMKVCEHSFALICGLGIWSAKQNLPWTFLEFSLLSDITVPADTCCSVQHFCPGHRQIQGPFCEAGSLSSLLSGKQIIWFGRYLSRKCKSYHYHYFQ